MSNVSVRDLHVVSVHMTDNLVGGIPAVQLWAAFVKRQDAVAAVQKRVPKSWRVELTDQQLTPEHVQRLGLRPGDVCELSSGR